MKSVVVLALVLAACSGGSHRSSSQPTTKPRTTHPVARRPQAPVSAQVVLPSRTIVAGSSMSGTVIIENNSGHPLNATGCGRLFQVALGNDKIRPSVQWLKCLQAFTIPVSESSYPVTVDASYLSCNSDGPQADLRACRANGQPPPLPPGDYRAMLFETGTLVPAPPPTSVRVTPEQSAR